MIGVFDSGYGGLTVLREFVKLLPQYDYCYLGDNARTPYGTRSFETVYRYTLECVKCLFEQGCKLVILACNTASAKALRTIQQNDLALIAPERRVLGVIRPSVEALQQYTQSSHVGVMGTTGTVLSNSYPIEIAKISPQIKVFQEACPIWVSLVENNEYENEAADYFIKKHMDRLMQQSSKIDVIILACTHYPLLIDKIKKYTPSGVNVLSQGAIVAKSLQDYLRRHTEMDMQLTKNKLRIFQTTDSSELFDQHASIFFGEKITSQSTSNSQFQ